MPDLTVRLDPAEAPASRVPARFWPDPHTVIFGHLVIGEPVVDGDLVRYSATFAAGPLNDGEQPVYDLRVTPKEPDRA